LTLESEDTWSNKKSNLTKPLTLESEDTWSNKKSSYITKARLKYYPVIYFIQVAALWLDRGCEWYNGERNFTFCAIYVTTLNFAGFMNALVYGFTEGVFDQWSRCLKGKSNLGIASKCLKGKSNLGIASSISSEDETDI